MFSLKKIVKNSVLVKRGGGGTEAAPEQLVCLLSAAHEFACFSAELQLSSTPRSALRACGGEALLAFFSIGEEPVSPTLERRLLLLIS